MRDFFNYYKWHLFFFGLFVLCIVIFTFSSCSKSKPDLIINCISTEYVNVQTFNDNKGDMEALLQDADGDKKKHAVLVSYTYDIQDDLDELFLALCTPSDSDIIITTKATFEAFEEKELLDTTTNYLREAGSEKYDVLTDASGRIYAVSLEGNDYIKDMGFLDTTDLYMSVLAEKDGSDTLSTNKKNARNIAQVILKEGQI